MALTATHQHGCCVCVVAPAHGNDRVSKAGAMLLLRATDEPAHDVK